MADDIAALIKRVRAYGKKAGYTDSMASLKVFNDGKRLDELAEGSRMWPETIAAANVRLDELEAALEA